jgi:PelA/Pel-15E family pectate lyase
MNRFFTSAKNIFFTCALLFLFAGTSSAGSPGKQQILETMKRATQFMTEKVAYKGGYVWSYLPDFSRRWGEIEARETQIWMQSPGTSEMGNLYLDAYHATGDEYYYHAAQQVAAALIWGQLPCGGWNYLIDFGGDRSLREWYSTVGKNAWRLEEFQHYYGNATFDDETTFDAAKFMLRMYVEKHDPQYKPALDRAIQFVLESQYPNGAWPQRYPLMYEFSHHGLPDYTSFLTFNDGVIANNVQFLIYCYQALGDKRFLDPIQRGMNVFLTTQAGQPQPGWALQYTVDMKPAGARTYEPAAIVTHTTVTCIEQLLNFYEWTGDTRYLARIPEALEWLDKHRVPKEWGLGDYTHPTFLEVGTDKPLYVHRTGSNVFNGHYYVDSNHTDIIKHYGSFRRLDVPDLRARYEQLKATPPAEVSKNSPLTAGTGLNELPRYFIVAEYAERMSRHPEHEGKPVETIVKGLNKEGYWPTPLTSTSHPYTHDGSSLPATGDYSQTFVGDETDTSPYHAEHPVVGISTEAYIANMSALIQILNESGGNDGNKESH